MEKLRNVLQTGAGKAVGAAFGLVMILLVVVTVKNILNDPAVASANNRIFLDSAANPPKSFSATLTESFSIPIAAPTGGKTGYPAEECYWTKDGQPKKDPTYVLLNSYLGKSEATFCPDCGRLVVFRNPGAEQGHRPPPTQAEYQTRYGSLAAREAR